MARAQVLPTREQAWWDRARPEDIAHAYETTVAWKGNDPDLAQAHLRIGDELRERYGIDIGNVGADPNRVAEVLSERQAAAKLIPVRGFPDWEQHETDQLLNAADRHDRATESARRDAQIPELSVPLPTSEAGSHIGNPAASVAAQGPAAEEECNAGLAMWDSAERRNGHAEQMAAQGVDPVAIRAQYGADVSNAKHPRAAAATTRGAAKARKTAVRATGTQRERGDRAR